MIRVDQRGTVDHRGAALGGGSLGAVLGLAPLAFVGAPNVVLCAMLGLLHIPFFATLGHWLALHAVPVSEREESPDDADATSVDSRSAAPGGDGIVFQRSQDHAASEYDAPVLHGVGPLCHRRGDADRRGVHVAPGLSGRIQSSPHVTAQPSLRIRQTTLSTLLRSDCRHHELAGISSIVNLPTTRRVSANLAALGQHRWHAMNTSRSSLSCAPPGR